MGKQVWQYFVSHWKKGLTWVLILTLLFVIISFRVGTLFPGATYDEITYFNSVTSGKAVIQDPVYLPHKLVSYAVTKLSFSLTGIRLISVAFAIGFMIGTWYLLRLVFSRRTVVMAGILLLFNSWLLVIARSAIPDSSYLLAVAAAAAIYWILKHIDSWKVVPLSIILSIPFIYVPGLIYPLVIALIMYRQQVVAAVRALSPKQKIISSVFSLLTLLPLLIGSMYQPLLLVELLGLPTSMSAYQALPASLLENLKTLVYTSALQNPYTLVSLPHLDIFTSVFMLFGLYRLRFWAVRWQLMLPTSLLFMLALTSLGIIPLNALLPVIYAMVIYGVSFLLAQWYTVFPKNPIARGAGASLLLVSVLLIGYYHVIKFYVAWPNTPQTDENYNQILIK